MNKYEQYVSLKNASKNPLDEPDLEQFLPKTSRELIKEIALYLADLEEKYSKPTHTRLKRQGLELNKQPKRMVLAKADDFLSGLQRNKIVGFRALSSDIREKSRFIADNRIFTEGYKALDRSGIESIYQDLTNPDGSVFSTHITVLTISLAMLIVYTTRVEGELLNASPKLDHLYISKHLAPFFHLIIQTYSKLRASDIGIELMETRVKKRLNSQNAGSSAHSKKEPIFQQFIKWAIELPKDHPFRYTKDAAKYFVETVTKLEDPSLYKQVSATTIRTMGEKLKKHCTDTNIKHPISGRT